MRCAIALVLGALLVLLGVAVAAPPAAQSVASFVEARNSNSRPQIVHHFSTKDIPAAPAAPATGSAPVRGGGVIEWTSTDDYGIYTSSSISSNTGSVIFGNSLVSTAADPNKAVIAEVMGDFKPTATQEGDNIQVAASRDSTVFVSLSYDDTWTTILVSKYSADQSKPDWTYTLHNHVPAMQGVVVSADGSTIAVLATQLEYLSPNQTRLYIFKADSNVPSNMWTGLGGAYTLEITADGRYVAFHVMAYIYVLDTYTTALRWMTANLGFYDAALGFSEDGNYLAYGFTTLTVMKWNAQQSAYVKLWDATSSGFYVESIALNSETLAVGWASYTASQNRIQAFSPRSSEPTWTVDYDQVTNNLQDIPSSIAVTEDGQYILVGSWGSSNKSNPEVRVFWKLSPNPIYTLSTAGSVFTVDIINGSAMFTLNAVVGCKQTHANEFGRGGAFYSIYIPTRCKVSGQC